MTGAGPATTPLTPTSTHLFHWMTIAPLLALVALALTWGGDINGAVVAVVAVLLGAAVFAAVHHAQVVAHRVGEPFGSSSWPLL